MSIVKNLKKPVLIGVAMTAPLFFSGCAALIVGAGAGAAGAIIGSDSRTVSTMAYDQQIEGKAQDILNNNQELANSDDFAIDVYSMSGNVLVVGQTVNKPYLDWCLREIAKLDYVRHVYNYATIGKPISATDTANDSYITSKVKGLLLISKDISSGRFKVVTENANVYLMGYVTEDEAKRAVNQTLTVPGVRKIYTIFDYMNQTSLSKSGQRPIEVVPTRVENKSYVGNSTYVPPVSSDDNGGAMIVDDMSSTPALDQY